MSDQLPAELREFLARYIDSIAQLEALLLLRNAPDAVWDTQATAKRLYVGQQEASEALAHLAAHRLLSGDTAGYRFSPQTRELLGMVDFWPSTTSDT